MAYPIVWQIEDVFYPLISAIGVPTLASAASSISVWFTVTFTSDRFVAICYERLKSKFCTERTAAAFLAAVTVLGCLESLPWYFANSASYIIDDIEWGCLLKSSFYTSPAWAAFEIINYILTPCVPFFLILLFNVLTVRRILVSSQIRRSLRGQRSGEKHKDVELQNRQKSITLLFSISGSFVLLWLTKLLFSIYARIMDIRTYDYSDKDPYFVADHTAKMLQVLSSCTNTFIYTVSQTKFRSELMNAMTYPFRKIIKLWNRLKSLNHVN
ncbi:probable G-protein coupled receptor 139 isoform X2 [Stegostoma tigrinum]|uniref:probable G-protein coupled receptor 139 isoform X2 n=1 Tax=Stegostoma tigrinum TaxID=3053191 RepID=UPI00286FEE9B|nr:probable G-protein coupled receptor 139 isoform X2 [Stegostoma tigrinum]